MEIMNKSIEENHFLIKDNLEPNEMKMLCTKLQEKTINMAGVFSKENYTYRFQIMSKKTDLRPIAKELTNTYGGKGGGNSNLIQGILNITEEQVKNIINNLENVN